MRISEKAHTHAKVSAALAKMSIEDYVSDLIVHDNESERLARAQNKPPMLGVGLPPIQ